MNDDLATRLGRQLHEQADDLHAAPLTMESVRGRAHRLRRTRRLAVAGVAAAAIAAITVPTALLTGDLSGRTDPDLPPVTSSPTEAVNKVGEVRLDPLGAPEGKAPRVDFIVMDDERLVTPDGAYDLPDGMVQLARYADGWIGLQTGDFGATGTGSRLVELDNTLAMTEVGLPTGPTLLASDDGSRVAWTEIAGRGDWTLVNASADGTEPIRTSVPADTQVEGFLDQARVVFSTPDRDTGGHDYGVRETETTLDVATFGGFLSLGGVSEATGLVAGMTKYDVNGSSCSAVTDPVSGGRPLWRTCDYQLGDFSPDGRYIFGYASYFDGYGSPSLSILDAATGEPVVDYVSGRTQGSLAEVAQVVWEDEDSVVAVVGVEGRMSIVRADLDGTLTRVAEPRESADMSAEYLLPDYPFGQ